MILEVELSSLRLRWHDARDQATKPEDETEMKAKAELPNLRSRLNDACGQSWTTKSKTKVKAEL